MRKSGTINDRQLQVLARIAAGEHIDFAAERLTLSLGAIRDRGLVATRRIQGAWEASVTDAGRFYLAHGYHPEEAQRTIDKTPEARLSMSSSSDKKPTRRPRSQPATSGRDNGRYPLEKATKRELDAVYRGFDIPSLAFTLQQAAIASSVSKQILTDAIHCRRDDLPRLPAKLAGDRYVISALELLRWIDRLHDA